MYYGKNEFWLDYDCCPSPLWIVRFDPGMSISVQKGSSGVHVKPKYSNLNVTTGIPTWGKSPI